MDPQQELSQAPVTNIPTPEIKEALSAQSDSAHKFPVHFSLALVIATGAVYGFLALQSPSVAISQTQPAAVVASVPNPFDTLALEAQSAFVRDRSEHKIVHAKNADAQLPLASLTKVMLVLAVGDVLSPEDFVTISGDAVGRGERGGPAEGEVWRVKDLIDYTLVVSSNVGAEALAEAANEPLRARFAQAPEDGAAVWRMNMLAKELGLTKTYFLNPSGLDISPTQPSAMGSARDATILLAYAFKTNPSEFAATSQSLLTVGPQDGPIVVVQNTNDAIAQIPSLLMGKTGFTDLAGGNLGIVFTGASNHTFVATVLGSSQMGRFSDILAVTETAAR